MVGCPQGREQPGVAEEVRPGEEELAEVLRGLHVLEEGRDQLAFCVLIFYVRGTVVVDADPVHPEDCEGAANLSDFQGFLLGVGRIRSEGGW